MSATSLCGSKPWDSWPAGTSPWDSWPMELPSARETVGECDKIKELQDDETHREMHKEIRAKVMAACVKTFPCQRGAVFLAGGRSSEFDLYDSDVVKCEFRQEAYFKYVFGINEPDCMGLLDLETQESILLVPFTPDAWERFNGERREHSYYQEKYGVDQVVFTADLHAVLHNRNITKLFINHGQNSDSDNWVDNYCINDLIAVSGGLTFDIDKELLFPLLTEMRVFKTEKELMHMRKASLISSQAHVYCMRHAKPGMNEIQLEALFKAWTGYHGGSRHVAYTCICGTGPNGSILHYGHAGRPNDRTIYDGDMALLDMGGEYSGYATDITRSYPVNGVFSTEQRQIYKAVYEAHQAVLTEMKPESLWSDLHQLAERTILANLLEIGIVKGGTIEQMMAVHLCSVFMPHGLGHFIGLCTHDVGGYPSYGDFPKRFKTPGLSYCRTARRLGEHMVITVEPGVYFCEPVLKKALANDDQLQFIDTEVLERFRGFGGIRIEDDMIITKDGCENLSVLPVSIEEIEAVMKARLA